MSDAMTAEHPNAVRLRELYGTWEATRDEGPLVEACAEDVVWHVPGFHVLAGEHVGREAVRAVMAKLRRFPEGVFTARGQGVVADDANGLAIADCTVARPGVPAYDWRRFDVLRLLDDGRIAEIWTFASPDEGVEAGLACPLKSKSA